MRRLMLLVVLVLITVAALAVVGPMLPEGNPLREVGETIADGFGGGYGLLSPGG